MWWSRCVFLTFLCFVISFVSVSDCETIQTNPKIISELEKQFLAGMGLSKRPTVSRKNLKIPEKLIEKYFQKTGIKVDPLHFSDKDEIGSKFLVKFTESENLHFLVFFVFCICWMFS